MQSFVTSSSKKSSTASHPRLHPPSLWSPSGGSASSVSPNPPSLSVSPLLSMTPLSFLLFLPSYPTTLSSLPFLSPPPPPPPLSPPPSPITSSSLSPLLAPIFNTSDSLPVLFLSSPCFLSLILVFASLLSLYPSSDPFLSTGSSIFSLQNLSIICTGVDPEEFNSVQFNSDADFELESLCLTGIRAGDYGVNWLWRNCKKLKKLEFRSCETVGDNHSFLGFMNCLKGLQEVELRTCRGIVDGVLFNLAENCTSLNSLLIYDGGSKEGLLQFIRQCRCNLQKLDLRLPLDLDNNHLLAIAEKFWGLSILRLQSCCLVTGEGLKNLGVAVSDDLEELALINCDAIERESGLLSTLGQNLRKLRKLDLSHNDLLLDKELVSMLVSTNYLQELKLRGCGRLTNAALVSMSKNCEHLESVDIMNCCGIEEKAVELFVLNSLRLRRLQIEKCKLSGVVRLLALNKVIEVIA